MEKNNNRVFIKPEDIMVLWKADKEEKTLTGDEVQLAVSKMLVAAGIKSEFIGGTRISKINHQKRARITTRIRIDDAVIERKEGSAFADSNELRLKRSVYEALRNRGYFQRLNYYREGKWLQIEWDSEILLAFITNSKYDTPDFELRLIEAEYDRKKKKKNDNLVSIAVSRRTDEVGFHPNQVQEWNADNDNSGYDD